MSRDTRGFEFALMKRRRLGKDMCRPSQDNVPNVEEVGAQILTRSTKTGHHGLSEKMIEVDDVDLRYRLPRGDLQIKTNEDKAEEPQGWGIPKSQGETRCVALSSVPMNPSEFAAGGSLPDGEGTSYTARHSLKQFVELVVSEKEKQRWEKQLIENRTLDNIECVRSKTDVMDAGKVRTALSFAPSSSTPATATTSLEVGESKQADATPSKLVFETVKGLTYGMLRRQMPHGMRGEYMKIFDERNAKIFLQLFPASMKSATDPKNAVEVRDIFCRNSGKIPDSLRASALTYLRHGPFVTPYDQMKNSPSTEFELWSLLRHMVAMIETSLLSIGARRRDVLLADDLPQWEYDEADRQHSLRGIEKISLVAVQRSDEESTGFLWVDSGNGVPRASLMLFYGLCIRDSSSGNRSGAGDIDSQDTLSRKIAATLDLMSFCPASSIISTPEPTLSALAVATHVLGPGGSPGDLVIRSRRASMYFGDQVQVYSCAGRSQEDVVGDAPNERTAFVRLMFDGKQATSSVDNSPIVLPSIEEPTKDTSLYTFAWRVHAFDGTGAMVKEVKPATVTRLALTLRKKKKKKRGDDSKPERPKKSAPKELKAPVSQQSYQESMSRPHVPLQILKQLNFFKTIYGSFNMQWLSGRTMVEFAHIVDLLEYNVPLDHPLRMLGRRAGENVAFPSSWMRLALLRVYRLLLCKKREWPDVLLQEHQIVPPLPFEMDYVFESDSPKKMWHLKPFDDDETASMISTSDCKFKFLLRSKSTGKVLGSGIVLMFYVGRESPSTLRYSWHANAENVQYFRAGRQLPFASHEWKDGLSLCGFVRDDVVATILQNEEYGRSISPRCLIAQNARLKAKRNSEVLVVNISAGGTGRPMRENWWKEYVAEARSKEIFAWVLTDTSFPARFDGLDYVRSEHSRPPRYDDTAGLNWYLRNGIGNPNHDASLMGVRIDEIDWTGLSEEWLGTETGVSDDPRKMVASKMQSGKWLQQTVAATKAFRFPNDNLVPGARIYSADAEHGNWQLLIYTAVDRGTTSYNVFPRTTNAPIDGDRRSAANSIPGIFMECKDSSVTKRKRVYIVGFARILPMYIYSPDVFSTSPYQEIFCKDDDILGALRRRWEDRQSFDRMNQVELSAPPPFVPFSDHGSFEECPGFLLCRSVGDAGDLQRLQNPLRAFGHELSSNWLNDLCRGNDSLTVLRDIRELASMTPVSGATVEMLLTEIRLVFLQSPEGDDVPMTSSHSGAVTDWVSRTIRLGVTESSGETMNMSRMLNVLAEKGLELPPAETNLQFGLHVNVRRDNESILDDVVTLDDAEDELEFDWNTNGTFTKPGDYTVYPRVVWRDGLKEDMGWKDVRGILLPRPLNLLLGKGPIHEIVASPPPKVQVGDAFVIELCVKDVLGNVFSLPELEALGIQVESITSNYDERLLTIGDIKVYDHTTSKKGQSGSLRVSTSLVGNIAELARYGRTQTTDAWKRSGMSPELAVTLWLMISYADSASGLRRDPRTGSAVADHSQSRANRTQRPILVTTTMISGKLAGVKATSSAVAVEGAPLPAISAILADKYGNAVSDLPRYTIDGDYFMEASCILGPGYRAKTYEWVTSGETYLSFSAIDVVPESRAGRQNLAVQVKVFQCMGLVIDSVRPPVSDAVIRNSNEVKSLTDTLSMEVIDSPLRVVWDADSGSSELPGTDFPVLKCQVGETISDLFAELVAIPDAESAVLSVSWENQWQRAIPTLRTPSSGAPQPSHRRFRLPDIPHLSKPSQQRYRVLLDLMVNGDIMKKMTMFIVDCRPGAIATYHLDSCVPDVEAQGTHTEATHDTARDCVQYLYNVLNASMTSRHAVFPKLLSRQAFGIEVVGYDMFGNLCDASESNVAVQLSATLPEDLRDRCCVAGNAIDSEIPMIRTDEKRWVSTTPVFLRLREKYDGALADIPDTYAEFVPITLAVVTRPPGKGDPTVSSTVDENGRTVLLYAGIPTGIGCSPAFIVNGVSSTVAGLLLDEDGRRCSLARKGVVHCRKSQSLEHATSMTLRDQHAVNSGQFVVEDAWVSVRGFDPSPGTEVTDAVVKTGPFSLRRKNLRIQLPFTLRLPGVGDMNIQARIGVRAHAFPEYIETEGPWSNAARPGCPLPHGKELRFFMNAEDMYPTILNSWEYLRFSVFAMEVPVLPTTFLRYNTTLSTSIKENLQFSIPFVWIPPQVDSMDSVAYLKYSYHSEAEQQNDTSIGECHPWFLYPEPSLMSFHTSTTFEFVRFGTKSGAFHIAINDSRKVNSKKKGANKRRGGTHLRFWDRYGNTLEPQTIGDPCKCTYADVKERLKEAGEDELHDLSIADDVSGYVVNLQLGRTSTGEDNVLLYVFVRPVAYSAREKEHIIELSRRIHITNVFAGPYHLSNNSPLDDAHICTAADEVQHMFHARIDKYKALELGIMLSVPSARDKQFILRAEVVLQAFWVTDRCARKSIGTLRYPISLASGMGLEAFMDDGKGDKAVNFRSEQDYLQKVKSAFRQFVQNGKTWCKAIHECDSYECAMAVLCALLECGNSEKLHWLEIAEQVQRCAASHGCNIPRGVTEYLVHAKLQQIRCTLKQSEQETLLHHFASCLEQLESSEQRSMAVVNEHWSALAALSKEAELTGAFGKDLITSWADL